MRRRNSRDAIHITRRISWIAGSQFVIGVLFGLIIHALFAENKRSANLAFGPCQFGFGHAVFFDFFDLRFDGTLGFGDVFGRQNRANSENPRVIIGRARKRGNARNQILIFLNFAHQTARIAATQNLRERVERIQIRVLQRNGVPAHLQIRQIHVFLDHRAARRSLQRLLGQSQSLRRLTLPTSKFPFRERENGGRADIADNRKHRVSGRVMRFVIRNDVVTRDFVELGFEADNRITRRMHPKRGFGEQFA